MKLPDCLQEQMDRAVEADLPLTIFGPQRYWSLKGEHRAGWAAAIGKTPANGEYIEADNPLSLAVQLRQRLDRQIGTRVAQPLWEVAP